MNNQTLNEINKRDLDNCYFSISFSSSTIFFNDSKDYIYKRKVYTIIGCNVFGVRKYITSIFADQFEKTSNWYDFFLLLKKRGLTNIFFAVIPDNKYLKDAIKLAFPETYCFLSCFEIIDKIYKYFTQSYSSGFLEAIKDIFISEDINKFNLKVNDFYETYGTFPFIIDISKKYFDIAKSYFFLDFNLRKHIYSFYFNRDLCKKLTVFSHSKPYFFNINEFEQCLLPLIKTFETRMYTSKNEWNVIINLLYNYNKDLIMKYL